MFSNGAGTPPTTRVSRRAASRSVRAGSTLGAGSTSSTVPPASSAQHYATRSVSNASTIQAGFKRGGTAMSVDEGTVEEMQVEASTTTGQLDHQRDSPDKVLVKDDNYIVTERKGLPVEVQQAISFADPYTQPVKAVLDPLTGFALLVTSEYCLVWNWSQRSSSATTYVFPLPAQAPLPATVQAYSPLSFASLVHSPSSSASHQREPGLLVVSNLGVLRLWETVSLSFSGVDRYKSAHLQLQESELVRSLDALSPTSYLASTSNSRIFIITINSISGRTELSSRVLEKSNGWASSIFSSVFGGGNKSIDPRAGILALAISGSGGVTRREGGGEGERQVFAVMEKTCQVWNVSSSGSGERLVGAEVDVFAGILEALEGRKVGNEQWAMNEGKVEIIDAAVTSNGALAILVSHVTANTAQGFQSFAIVTLNIVGTLVEVAGITRLNYQSRPDPRPLSTPQLALGVRETAFVIFADAVVIASLASDSPFEENFPLRHNTNRFIGTSVAPSPSPTNHSSTLSLLTSTSSLLALTVTPPTSLLPLSITNTSETYKTRKLKAKVEHAIYFGTPSKKEKGAGESSENLFKFDLQRDYEGDLAVAVEGVSRDLLASASSNMPVILDLRAQLADRAYRARALVEYINDNGLVNKLPQSTRRQLSWDAERIAAAGALWGHQNARLGEQNVLSEAILSFMDSIGEGFGEDPLRLFFRSKVSSLGNVLEEVSKQAKSFLASAPSSETKTPVLHEANQVAILVFTAISRHRQETLPLYALDTSSIPTEPWSSRAPLLEGLQWHFETTNSLLSERVRDFGANEQANRNSNVDQREVHDQLRSQMASLAEYTFAAIEERLLFLNTSQGDGPASTEARTLNERYLSLRPRFIRTLVSIEKVSSAYELAERHRDFQALVELSTDAKNGSNLKVRSFLDKYQEDFAFPLYESYLEKGQLRTLLEPEESHRPLLTAFLDSTSNFRLGWINDVAIGRYEHATNALLEEGTKEINLTQKKILFSLGKLAQVAEVSKESIESEPVQRAIEAVDDKLDLVNSQQGLREYFVSLLSHAENLQTAEEKGQVIASRVASALTDRPTFVKSYASSSSRLVDNRSVSAEELIDLLTLKENVREQSGDFAAALDILVRAKDLPKARKQLALESIWRRVYIQDDWTALRSATGLRDEEMAGALRNTAFYATLANASASNHPPSLYLEPLQSLSSATIPLLSALRSSSNPSSTDLDLILADYETENRKLEAAVRRDGLEEYAKEIVRLVRSDEIELEGSVTEGGGGGGMGDEAMMDE